MYQNQYSNPAIIQPVEHHNFFGYHFNCPLNFNNIDDVRNQDIENIVQKNLSLYNYFSYFENVCLTLFDFGDMLNLKNTVLNRLLFNFGKFAIVKTGDGYALRQCIVTDYNENGEPSKIQAWKYIPLGTHSTTIKDDFYTYNDFVLFNLNPSHTPLKYYVFYFCSKIVDIQLSIDNNVWQQQQPVIIEATDDQKLAFTNFFEKLTNRVKVIFLKKGAHIEDNIKVTNLSGEWFGDKGISIKEDYKREFFTMLGIDHIPFEKKERLITAEASSNGMMLELSRNAMLMSLNEALKEAKNKGFNLGIDKITYSVEPAEPTGNEGEEE